MSATSFYSDAEVASLGFARTGSNVRISRYARFYGIERITIGSNTRIDDFCVLSAGAGGIMIGSHVHIAVMCTLIGIGKITVEDFVGLSGRVSVYSSTDNFDGEHLTGPMVPVDLTRVDTRPVFIGRHSIVGSGSVILPGSYLSEGAAIGALSLVKGKIDEFVMAAGVPAVEVRKRARGLLDDEAELMRRNAGR